jgi:hypothetical protein
MARIELDEKSITIGLERLERLWALRTRVTVDRSAVRVATAYDDVMSEVRGVRAPGLGVPGVGIGTWRSRGGKDLVVVRRGQPGVVIELDGSRWRRFVIGCPDRASADRVVAAL